MLKVPSKISIILSMSLSVIFMATCILGAFIMPSLCRILIDMRFGPYFQNGISATDTIVIITLSYMLLAVFMLADSLLFALLIRVKGGKVFTQASVSLIRGVSWCCFLLCGVCIGLGLYFNLSFLVAFLAVFLGICLRVVKNVIEQATIIKNENDLTV